MARNKRSEKLPQFVPLLHGTMDSPAWMALKPYAKALYPAMKRRAGASGTRNGSFSMSVREAADYLGCDKNTASKAMGDLQAKGFATPKQIGSIGANGIGNATVWRLTEIGTPDNHTPSAEYLQWQPGNDFPVKKGAKPKRVIDRPVKKEKPV